MKYRVLLAVMLFAGIVHAADDLYPLAPLPVKWVSVKAPGFDATQCVSGVDENLEKDGIPNLSIKCRNTGFMGARQDISARDYWGKRVRYSAMIRTEGVDPADAGGRAGAGLSVTHGAMTNRPVNDMMDPRRVRGTTDWQYHEIVFDVAPNSQAINLGIWLRGKGQVWVRNFKFEVVGSSLPDIGPTASATSGITLVAPASAPPQPLAPLPTGWTFMIGGGPLQLQGRCEAGIDSTMTGSSQPIHSLRCTDPNQPTFGGAQYSFDLALYRGKRVRFSGWLKAAGIGEVANPRYASARGEAGLWMAIDTGTNVRQDRMQDRTIRGTTDWVYRDFILDVPAANGKMVVGFWMQGIGQLWVRDLKVEEVPTSVAPNFLGNGTRGSAAADFSLQ